MKPPEAGDGVRYRRPGGKPVVYEGTVIEHRCRECGPGVVHVKRDAGAVHHVPIATVFCVVPGGFRS